MMHQSRSAGIAAAIQYLDIIDGVSFTSFNFIFLTAEAL